MMINGRSSINQGLLKKRKMMVKGLAPNGVDRRRWQAGTTKRRRSKAWNLGRKKRKKRRRSDRVRTSLSVSDSAGIDNVD